MHSLRNTAKLLFILTGLILFSFKPVIAQQSLSNIDFSQVQVDNLSDQQILSVLKQAQARGISNSELVQMAVAKGMSPSEASKLQTRLENVQSNYNLNSNKQAVDSLNISPQQNPLSQLLNARKVSFPNLNNTVKNNQNVYPSLQDSLASKGDIFGYSLFNTKNLTFAPTLNIPTPKDYVLGGGDELVINIWGAAQMTYQETIAPDGTIQIGNLGPIYLSGLSISKAKKRIINRLSEIYSGLSPDNPQKRNTYADVTLGKIRNINVTLVGDVRAPGTYSIPSLSTVFNALYVSGGPGVNGSFRTIQVVRNNKVVDTLDVYDFLMNGGTKKNIHLQDQDIIKVNPYQDRVYITGQIKRPLLYEVKPNESLSDVINFAGGFLDNAYTQQIKIFRNTPTERKIVVVNKPDFSSFKLQNGDEIFVGKILSKFQNLVKIQGAVWRPGDYELSDASTVSKLIQQASGIKGNAYMSRALIYRKQENEKIKVIPFNLSKLINDPADNDIKLEKDDVVLISSIFEMNQKYTVDIKGDVQNPGTFPYMDNMTLNDLIMEANGFNESAAPSHIQIARLITQAGKQYDENKLAKIYNFSTDRNLQLNSKDKEFKLKPFDQIYVFKEPFYNTQKHVTVSGQVLYPGDYVINSKTETISDIINRAGGLTKQAYTQGATITRTNSAGLTGPIGIDLPKILANPGSKYDIMVMDGDHISVPKRLQTVKVQGAVMFANNIRYDKHYSLHDYIDMAGGFSDSAATKKVYVIYPNGSVNHIKRFLFFRKHPKIEPGTKIIVPTEHKQRLSPQERIGILSAIVSMSASLITALAIAARYL